MSSRFYDLVTSRLGLYGRILSKKVTRPLKQASLALSCVICSLWGLSLGSGEGQTFPLLLAQKSPWNVSLPAGGIPPNFYQKHPYGQALPQPSRRFQQCDMHSTDAPRCPSWWIGGREGVAKKRGSNHTGLCLCFHLDSKRPSIYPGDWSVITKTQTLLYT